MSEGKSFHIHAPVTGNAQCPTVESLMAGTDRLSVVEDWSLCWDGMSAVGEASAISQPTRPTQPAIPKGSVKWVVNPLMMGYEGGDLLLTGQWSGRCPGLCAQAVAVAWVVGRLLLVTIRRGWSTRCAIQIDILPFFACELPKVQHSVSMQHPVSLHGNLEKVKWRPWKGCHADLLITIIYSNNKYCNLY